MAFTLKKRAAEESEPKQKPVRLKKAKGFKAAKGSRFVLFIGDEGAILVYIKDNVVQSRQFVPDAGQQNLDELAQSIAKDPLAPILLVIDTMDQSYVQQTLPPVSSLSVNKLIKRRLDRDFAADDIKGAILLGRETDGRKDWNFMMVSLERSPQLTVWLDFVSALPNHFRGIHLIPVEAEILVKYLDFAANAGSTAPKSEWQFFVSHNKVGGFRQVILRHGRILFTRVSQPIGDSSAEMIAGNIEQEMLSTIEYMKRLSFNQQAGLDVYIIASSAIKSAFDQSKFAASAVHILTPYEVAQQLGIEGATQPTDQFGDVVLAAFMGCSRKHILTLTTPKSRQLDTYHQLVTYQRIGGALAALGLLAYIGMIFYDIYDLGVKTEETDQKRIGVQQSLNSLKGEIERSKIDIEKANDLIDLYKQLLDEKLLPLPFIEQLRPAVQVPVVVKQVEWELQGGKPDGKGSGAPDAPAPSRQPGGKPGDKTMQSTVTLEFPEIANDPKIFRAILKKAQADFKQVFVSPYQVNFTSIPPSLMEKESFNIDFGQESESVQIASGNKQDNKLPEVKLQIIGEALSRIPAAPPTDSTPKPIPIAPSIPSPNP